MIHLVDHLFILILFVVQPIHGAREFNQYVKRVEAGEPADRIKLYRQALIIEWVAFGVLALTWYLLGRPVADLGYVTPGGVGFWVGAAFIAAVSTYLLLSWRQSKHLTAKQKEPHIASFGKLQHFMPHSDQDYRHFAALSVTAGIVEETLYRGFVIWYLLQFMPAWAAVAVSAIAFGLGHSYQGTGGVLRVTAVGLVAGALYLLTGSIWVPIVGHILLDALQGLSIVEILRKDDRPSATQPA
ncbi:MAG: CPBP family intramembrane metalloprotease [Gammaproteobacteria bacterium]|nr:CPBP family intramembrane metalloprotease [Woeseia sp.]MBU2676380.1 CPBP family intramembrane metalloprotease [Gammaproteobacteria bacterium]NNL50114.1 CPBP family intramembrane metalloprotease [Woeseiaceae bacterium]